MLRLDSINILNLVLCIIILVLGYRVYQRNKDKLSLNIAIAFGFFGLSHLIVVLGLAKSLITLLIIIRLLAYMIVVLALYKALAKR